MVIDSFVVVSAVMLKCAAEASLLSLEVAGFSISVFVIAICDVAVTVVFFVVNCKDVASPGVNTIEILEQ